VRGATVSAATVRDATVSAATVRATVSAATVEEGVNLGFLALIPY
jgi:hypothetical protein